MIKHSLSAFLIILCGLSAHAESSPSPAPNEAEQYIRKGAAEWAASVATGDSSTVERILADDFSGVDPKGRTYDKASMIADTRKAAEFFASNKLDEVKVRFFGDTAVAHGSESWVRRNGERGRFVWIDTWLKRDGRWQIVAAEDLSAPPTATPEEDTIHARRRAQNVAIAAGKVEEIASFWTDEVTICRGLGGQLAGKAAYRKLFEFDPIATAAGEKIVYQREPNSIEVSPHWPLAFETGRWSGRSGSTTGSVLISGKYSAQWVKRNGEWFIRSEVFTALGGSGAGLELKVQP